MLNNQRIIVVATAFNLLFEYSLRGIAALPRQPGLLLVLIAVYASLFTLQNDLIRRYRFQDYHLLLLAFTYGMVYQCLVSGAAFVKPTAFGINWPPTLFVIVIWWGTLQSIFTFYLANRLAPRDWQASPLSRRGWVVALTVNIGCIILFQASQQIPTGLPIGYLTMVVVSVGAGLVLRRVRPRDATLPTAFAPRRLLDWLVAITLLLFVFSAVFLRGGVVLINEASLVNASAVAVISWWTMILAGVLLIARLLTRKVIPV